MPNADHDFVRALASLVEQEPSRPVKPRGVGAPIAEHRGDSGRRHPPVCSFQAVYGPRGRHAVGAEESTPSRGASARPRSRRRTCWARSADVVVSVEPGSALGLVGRNGSGKSTLLRIIAAIIKPTSGRVEVGGRIGTLLELGAGFHPDFTGRENVFLNGSILGLKRSYIRERFDEIVAFAELEDFIDVPVRTYSSGMYMRLGFAVASHLNADVLLLDEVFAVGDAAFQRKCLDKILDFKRKGGTIVSSPTTPRLSSVCASVRSCCATDALRSTARRTTR